MTGRRVRVLAVEDDAQMRKVYDLVLGKVVDLTVVASADAAIAALENARPDVVLSDFDLGAGEQDGIWLLERVQQRWPAILRVLITGVSPVDIVYGTLPDLAPRPFGR